MEWQQESVNGNTHWCAECGDTGFTCARTNSEMYTGVPCDDWEFVLWEGDEPVMVIITKDKRTAIECAEFWHIGLHENFRAIEAAITNSN